MKFVLVLIATAQFALASQEWERFKIKYNKFYETPEEDGYHERIFLRNLQLVEENNKKYEEGLSTYKMKINRLADLARDETRSSGKQVRRTLTEPVSKAANYKISPRTEVPDSIDWRDYGVISPVADQMACDSCWAFAIVATIEAYWAMYKGANVSLSQQNLEECVDDQFTCYSELAGDILERSYQYVIDNGGIDTLESYPYKNDRVESCHFNSENVGATIRSYVNLTEGDEEQLKQVVGTIGPVTVAITTTFAFDLYDDGVFYDPACESNTFLNHAVVIVGYGTEKGQDYWLAKNSWGPWFGQDGYIKMSRNRDNNCGVASVARYPIV